jgi:anti-anti-sigma regulatory factor
MCRSRRDGAGGHGTEAHAASGITNLRRGEDAVCFAGEALRGDGMGALRAQLVRLAVERGPGELRVDLRNVGLATAAGLGELVLLQGELRAVGGELVRTSARARVREVFGVAGLSGLLGPRPA